MKVLVAGGSGFIGRATVAALARAGHQVVVLARSGRASTDANVTVLAMDATAARGTEPSLVDVEAIVNLVGVAHEQGPNTFAHAHVEVPRALIGLADQLGVARFVHVGVIDMVGAADAYATTKREGEALVRASGLNWTVVRPALVYGPGDDMLTRLCTLIRAAPVFAVPAGPCGALAAVDVDDVAAAIVNALADTDSSGCIVDIAGPERLSLAQLVNAVSIALALPTQTIAVPRRLMAIAVEAMAVVMPRPLVTRSQLQMLIVGLDGDARSAHVLGVTPRPISGERIGEVANTLPTPWWSVRLQPDGTSARRWQTAAAAAPDLRWFIPLTLTAGLAVSALAASLVVKMALVNLVLAAVAVRWIRLDWRARWRPRRFDLVLGSAWAGGLFAITAMVLASLRAVSPGFVAEAQLVYAAVESSPSWLVLGVAPLVVLAEDLVWRSAIALPLAARLGGFAGVTTTAVLFALVHVPHGPPVLVLGALAAGWAWGALGVRTGRLFPVFICHLLWDAAIVLSGPL